LLAGIACIVAGGLFVISLWRPEGALGIAAQIYVVAVGTAQVVLSGTAVVIAQQTCRSTESALAGDDSDFEEEGISR
jgi:Na+-driven multidrug efflux pump